MNVKSGRLGTIGVVGAGQMGRGIAQVSALADLRVVLHDTEERILEAAKSAIDASLQAAVGKGKISQVDMPATIALLAGRVRVGLDAPALEHLARADVAKCSVKDLAALAAAGADGATTVAATLRIAVAAGIAVFATGGIGGVHPGWAGAIDVSADLVELARSPAAMVAAGAKSILDLAATLEVLESYGVPVIGFSTGEFPAFHSPESGLALRHRVDTVAELAEIVRAQRALALPGANASMIEVQRPSITDGMVNTSKAAR